MRCGPAQADRRLEPRPGLVRARRRRRARRPARRRRSRHCAPRAGRPSRRHVDRERDDRGGPRRRTRARRRGDRASSRVPVRPTGCGCSRTTRSPTTATTTTSRTARSGSSSTTSGGSRRSPSSSRRSGRRGHGYAHVNQAFAAAVIEELDRDPTATVCFQDYHLYLAPRLRARGARPTRARALRPHPVAAVRLLARAARGRAARGARGPARERRRRLPHRALAPQLLEACRRRAECDSRRVPRHDGDARCRRGRSRIDPGEFDELRESPAVLDGGGARSPRRGPSCSIVRVDRTDPSKNIVRGFRAFALLLERHPGAARARRRCSRCSTRRGRTSRRTPSTSTRSSARRARSTSASATDGWRPVDLQVGDNFPQAVAAYKQFDVLLVNPIFDGMNLVAKEAPLVNGRDGVVVLSENAGAHEEIGEWAITVNPFDIEGQAEALYEALTMAAGRSAGGAPRRSTRTCASTTSRRGCERPARRPRPAARRPRPTSIAAMTELSHVDESSGAVQMVDVGHKPLSRRRAIARGDGADGARDRAAAARAAEGRRARRPRSSPGSWRRSGRAS